MIRLNMHWHVVQGTDGRKHLDIAWEAVPARVVPSVSLPKSTEVRGKNSSASAIILTCARLQ